MTNIARLLCNSIMVLALGTALDLGQYPVAAASVADILYPPAPATQGEAEAAAKSSGCLSCATH